MSVHVHVSLCVGQVRIEALIKYRREKIRSQRANVIRAWMTEDDMVQAKFSTPGPWETDDSHVAIEELVSYVFFFTSPSSYLRAKITGAMKYCTAHKLVKSFGCTVMSVL